MVVTDLPTIPSTRGNTAEELKKAAGVITPRVEHVLQFQEVIDALCRDHPEIACVGDALSVREAGKGPPVLDDCHPLPEGHAVIARRVFDVLGARPELGSRTAPAAATRGAGGES